MISVTFLVACFNLFLAFIILVQNWKLNKNVLSFSFYLMIVSFSSILYDSLINGGSAHFLMLLIGNAGPLFFLMGPLFYFFVRGLVEDNKGFSDKDLLHLVPFFLNMIVLVPYLFKPVEYKLELAQNSLQNLPFYLNSTIVYFPIWFSNIVRIFSIAFYVIWAMVILRRAYKERIVELNGPMKKQYTVNFWWLNAIAIASLFLVIIHFRLTLYFRFDPELIKVTVDDDLLVVSLFVNAFFPLIILLNPGILFGLPTNQVMNPIIRVKELSHDEKSNYSVLEAADREKTYTEYFDGLSKEIISFIENEKAYLNHDFIIRDLSHKFQVPHHHIQFCLKYYVGMSFNELVSMYRVKYAIDKVRASSKKQADFLVNIAYESGFNNLVEFKKAFKKTEKMSIAQWLVENT
jgi:AraC-like DNA-binding protein